MADIILGDMCRKNFGLNFKYKPELNSTYKEYIDTLEREIITATYGNDINLTKITKTMNLVLTQDQIDQSICIGIYDELEQAIADFCKNHNIGLKIQRFSNYVVVYIDLLVQYSFENI